MPDFKLPDLGEGVTEAEIDRWLVNEGDVIGEDDPLVDVITDKATAEIPSPFAGTVARIHVEQGATVPVGTVLVTVLAPGETPSEAPMTSGESTPEAQPQSSAPPPPPSGQGSPRPSEERLSAIPSRARATVTNAQPGGGSNGVKAMPPVRKLARDLGVNLESVAGSGPDGRVLREDVEAAAQNAPAAAAPSSALARSAPAATPSMPPPPVQIATGGTREPLRGVRRKIAERLTYAHRVVPPVTHVEECDVTELDATRKLANERAPGEQKLTFMPFIVKAVTTCLKQYPALNASMDEEAGEIVFFDRYDMGIAIDTPAGLTVGVVKGADRLRLRALAAEVERLATAAREGKLTPDDQKDPTFTISSPGGQYGGLMATPIVFHPQSAILGVHRAGDRPVVRNGQIVIRKMMNLSITFDHRILDGMTAARFILDVIKLLEHPAVLALES